MVDIVRVSDLGQLVDTAATQLTSTICGVQASGGRYGDGVARLVVTGGGAGIALLRRLAELDYAARQQAESFPIQHIDWTRVHVFFGDERAVPVTHPDSNEGQAREALFDHVDIPDTQIHSYQLGSCSLTDSAEHYRSELKKWAPNGFDVHLLGMGGEGHINSLFPHTAALAEQSELVVAVDDSPKPPAQRVTLTLPAINSADNVWLLVAGAEKAEAAAAVAHSASPEQWPAAGVNGRLSTKLFLADDAAHML